MPRVVSLNKKMAPRYATHDDLSDTKKEVSKMMIDFYSHDKVCADRYGHLLKDNLEMKASIKAVNDSLQTMIRMKNYILYGMVGIVVFMSITSGKAAIALNILKSAFSL